MPRLLNYIPAFGMKALSHSIDVGYPGVYLWVGKLAISFGEEKYLNCGYPEPNYPFGIYIRFKNFKWSNWDLEESDLP